MATALCRGHCLHRISRVRSSEEAQRRLPVGMSADAREEQRQQCVQAAVVEGIKWGGIGVVVGIALTLSLKQTWPSFRRLNASAQTAVVHCCTVLFISACMWHENTNLMAGLAHCVLSGLARRAVGYLLHANDVRLHTAPCCMQPDAFVASAVCIQSLVPSTRAAPACTALTPAHHCRQSVQDASWGSCIARRSL